MGNLKGMNEKLANLIKQANEERVAGMFDVDPGMLREPEEPEEDQEHEDNEALCEAIACLEKAVLSGSEAQVDAIKGNVLSIPEGLATDKGIEKALQAHANAVKLALKDRPDTGIQGLLERIVELVAQNQALQAAMVKEETKEEVEPMQFTITRDKSGYIESVLAKPYQPAPATGKTYTLN